MKVSTNASAPLSRAESSSSLPRSIASILLSTSTFGSRRPASVFRIASVSSLKPGSAAALPRIDQKRQHVRVRRRSPGGGDHRPVEPPVRGEEAGRIDEDDLRLASRQHAAHGRARRLGLTRDDRHLFADERVDQRRLAGVRRSDQRDEAAAGCAHLALHRSRKACAAACSAARFDFAAPISGS